MNKFLLSMTIATYMSSCLDNSDLQFNMGQSQLQMTTKVYSPKVSKFVEIMPERAEVGLFIANDKINCLHTAPFQLKNIKAKASMMTDRRRWLCNPPIDLTSVPISIFAYYPYLPMSSLNPFAIPIQISADAKHTSHFLYGTLAQGHKPVSSYSPIALISMHHALSLVSICIFLSKNEKKPFYLNSIQIGNKAGGNAFVQQALLDITNGKIKALSSTPGATILKFSLPIRLHPNSPEEYGCLVIPTLSSVKKGDIEILLTINHQKYIYQIPANTCWKKGYKYTYSFMFTGEEIQFIDVTENYL